VNRVFFFIIVFFLAVLQVFPIPLESLVPQAQQLRTGGIILETHLRNSVPVLLPRNNELQQFVNREIQRLNPTMMVELLYLFEKPDQYHSDIYSWNDEQKINVFNQLLAISSMTGFEYYSGSRGEMRVFYDLSQVIDDPRTKRPLPDPTLTFPAELTLYARQRDLTFGDNIYRYDYTTIGNIIYFTQENVTTLSVGIVPVIGKGNLRSVVTVIDCGDSILIYAVSMANAVQIPGLWNRISTSFSNRAEAVLKWFTARLESEVFI